MNALKKIIPALLLVSSMVAGADGVLITRTYEVPLNLFRMPGARNGTLTFRVCDECETLTFRVTEGTDYVVNSDTRELKDFRKTLARVRDRASATVMVTHHLESDTVTTVRIDL
ncbi:MAG: hypothetical protein OEW35_06195 [Gammaproteobacteria bacterium]|nr:hypothetical protein [Gammaproteobacteria bacterium]MDH4253365.1 hypothetical protein [Gammaproteobacteria bacterium]MDH5310139.1 hypothetical protein [Gammaproteobacteria bacterium]